MLTLNFLLALKSLSLIIVSFILNEGVDTPRVHGWFKASSAVGLFLGSIERSCKKIEKGKS